MRQAVYGTARIGLHRSFSTELQRRNDGKPLSFHIKVLAGMASGSIAVCLGTPFDVALVRQLINFIIAVKRHQRHVHKKGADASGFDERCCESQRIQERLRCINSSVQRGRLCELVQRTLVEHSAWNVCERWHVGVL